MSEKRSFRCCGTFAHVFINILFSMNCYLEENQTCHSIACDRWDFRWYSCICVDILSYCQHDEKRELQSCCQLEPRNLSGKHSRQAGLLVAHSAWEP